MPDFGDLWFGGEKEIERNLRKEFETTRGEAVKYRRTVENILKGNVPRRQEFESRVASLFAPLDAAMKEESPYLAAGDAKATLENVKRNWEELYYDMKFAVLLGE